MMRKTVCFIILGFLLLCITIGLCLYTIPATVAINNTLQATKLDHNGNVIGTEEIALQGAFKNYLFKDDTLELSIGSFGTFNSIILANDNRGNTSTVPVVFADFYVMTFMAWDNTKDQSIFGTITASQDFEYWVFRVNHNDNPEYYVASASGEHTPDEIVQYFKGIAPGYEAP